MHMEPYATIEKEVGETPLQALERLRSEHGIAADVPLAYAGRLDPMASGKLLVLIGDECKRQEQYHGLDKEYEFQILFGIGSDTGDVLGLVRACDEHESISMDAIVHTAHNLIGPIALPYPHFSSKTVRGKPLHIWTLENRLNEIEIPTKESMIYSLAVRNTETYPITEIYDLVMKKIDTIPTVTEESKALGRDFRRVDVRAHWHTILNEHRYHRYTIADLTCVASSGTYMRSLAEMIAKRLNTCGLAYSIHRTKIGRYTPMHDGAGFWQTLY